MAAVNVTNITVFDNPCIFTTGFRFEVTFECVAPLTDGAWLCWRAAARRGGAVRDGHARARARARGVARSAAALLRRQLAILYPSAHPCALPPLGSRPPQTSSGR